MEFYAACARKPGEKIKNSDALMIKGSHMKSGTNLIMMTLCSPAAKRAGAKGAMASDVVIREAEAVFEECRRLDYGIRVRDIDVNEYLVRYTAATCERLFELREADDMNLAVCVMAGTKYAYMRRGSVKMLRVSRLSVSSLETDQKRYEKTGDSEGYTADEGALSEGCTIVIGTDHFASRVSDAEMHKVLCPQMCDSDSAVRSSVEELCDNASLRGERSPQTAVVLCVK